jgi:hypothetical protein
VVAGAKDALAKLCLACRTELPEAILAFADAVEITSASGKGDEVHFPCPLREQEAVTAIKALEACAAAAIAQLRYGMESKKIRIDVDRVSAFLMSAYLTTLDGMDKADPRIRERIPGGRISVDNVSPHRISQGLTCPRHGPEPGPVGALPPHVGEPVQNQKPGRVLPHPRVSRRRCDPRDAGAA